MKKMTGMYLAITLTIMISIFQFVEAVYGIRVTRNMLELAAEAGADIIKYKVAIYQYIGTIVTSLLIIISQIYILTITRKNI